MLLIVGLGNPGQKYANQRHNVGFMAVDEIHRHAGFPAWKTRFHAMVSEGIIADRKCILAKPTTFMNESGRAVGEIARFFKIPADQILVLYDELDLAPGKVRIKRGGGAGGHNGIRSIDAHLGKDYRRLRIGIGHPGQKGRVTGHVLGDFAKSDIAWRDPLLEEIGRNVELLVKEDDAGFMNRLAVATRSDEPSGAKGQRPPREKSHIRQANQAGRKPRLPTKGPMADMLSKLFGSKDG